MKLTQRKSFRYGGAAIGLTAAVVAVVVVFNVIVSAIFSAVGEKLDMTADNLFELSDTANELLADRGDHENQVTIYFMADRDQLNQPASSGNHYSDYSAWGMKYIVELAEELAERHSYINVEYIDLNTEGNKIKSIVGKAYYESEDRSFGVTSVLIDNYMPLLDNHGDIVYNDNTGEPQEYWHNYRLYNRNSFYGFNSSYYATSFKGEYRLISAILSVTQRVAPTAYPTAYFITGHGEAVGEYEIGEENDDYGSAAYLWNLLRDCGYQIRKIDLQYEDFDHTGNAVAIIFGPETDYISSDSSNDGELEKLQKFTETSGNSLMVFLNPGIRSLPKLEGFLEETAGVDYLDAKLKDDGSAGIHVDGYGLVGSRAQGSDLLSQRLTAVDGDEKMIFRNTRPIRVTDPSKASAIYTVPASSYADAGDAEQVKTGDALLTFSTVSEGSYLLAAGTTMLAHSNYTDRAEYANREVLVAAMGLMSGDDSAHELSDKVIPNEGLNITTAQATRWTVILSVALPSVIAVLGLAVNIRRRYS
ncbi:MAG: Gldg family protein [Clostridia bacterium]|nr:Gldg family protein [Clostridia bacterium]